MPVLKTMPLLVTWKVAATWNIHWIRHNKSETTTDVVSYVSWLQKMTQKTTGIFTAFLDGWLILRECF